LTAKKQILYNSNSSYLITKKISIMKKKNLLTLTALQTSEVFGDNKTGKSEMAGSSGQQRSEMQQRK
jgi:hypothetical protein